MALLCNRSEWLRRLSAMVLLAVLLAPLLALWTIVDPAASPSLPACCRAHGQHHCAMPHAPVLPASDNGTPALSHLTQRCPWGALAPAPHAPHTPGTPTSASHHRVFLAVALHSALQHGRALLSDTRTHPQRGPPIAGAPSRQV